MINADSPWSPEQNNTLQFVWTTVLFSNQPRNRLGSGFDEPLQNVHPIPGLTSCRASLVGYFESSLAGMPVPFSLHVKQAIGNPLAPTNSFRVFAGLDNHAWDSAARVLGKRLVPSGFQTSVLAIKAQVKTILHKH